MKQKRIKVFTSGIVDDFESDVNAYCQNLDIEGFEYDVTTSINNGMLVAVILYGESTENPRKKYEKVQERPMCSQTCGFFLRDEFAKCHCTKTGESIKFWHRVCEEGLTAYLKSRGELVG